MSGPNSPTRERRACLTPLGEVAALGLALRDAVPGLSELDARRIVCELRQLVTRYAVEQGARS